MYCSQHHHHSRRNNFSYKTTSRHYQSKRIEQCSGYISIGKSKPNNVLLRCYHRVHHESGINFLSLSTDDLDRIQVLSNQDLKPFQICSVLNSEGRSIMWNQVYYRWSLIQRSVYMKKDGPYTSARQCIESCDSITFCYESRNPRALGFITNVRQHISKYYECAELLIDSTNRTNSSKFVLFCVIVEVLGVGFPLAYLFYESNRADEAGYRRRNDVLCSFLLSIWRFVYTLHQKYFSPSKTLVKSLQFNPLFMLRHQFAYSI